METWQSLVMHYPGKVRFGTSNEGSNPSVSAIGGSLSLGKVGTFIAAHECIECSAPMITFVGPFLDTLYPFEPIATCQCYPPVKYWEKLDKFILGPTIYA